MDVILLEDVQGLGDAGAGDGASGVVEVLVFLAEDPGQDLAEAAPFGDQVFEHAGVGVEGDKAVASHFQPHAQILLDQPGMIVEPPVTDGHDIVVVAAQHTGVVLVGIVQRGDEEGVVGVAAHQLLVGEHVG